MLQHKMFLTGISSVHKETNSFPNQFRKKQGTVVHAIALEHERLVNLHIARFEFPRWIYAKGSLVLRVVHPCFDPAHLLVAKRPVGILGTVALAAYIV